MNEYKKFLKDKQYFIEPSGFDVDKSELNKHLFDFQKDIVKWALKKGKCALFMDTGTGKTICQLEWANQICKKENKNVLILAPLAVSIQTKQEGKRFDIDVNICRKQSDVKNGINITNYEMIDHFNADEFVGVVLDESSIIKHFMGKTSEKLIRKFKNTKYKLACTATPAPNDHVEFGTHSEFLNIMSRVEMLATFFINDAKETQWRMKRHAEGAFWEWLSKWAIVMNHPKNLGYDEKGYDLPKLNIKNVFIENFQEESNSLFGYDVAKTLTERRQARRDSVKLKIEEIKSIINNVDNCLVWCDYNYESEEIAKAVEGIVEVKGSDSNEHKEKSMSDFADGELKFMVSKPSICGFGMNFQQCNTMIFCGLSDSYERFYQAIRRCWRFGQKKPVDVYVLISRQEQAILQNIQCKKKQHDKLTKNMVKKTSEILKKELKNAHTITEDYNADIKIIIPEWLKSEV